MARATLLTLDKKVLVDLIPSAALRQALHLQATVTRLEERSAALEAELAAQRPPPKTSTTSSVPPSQGPKPNPSVALRTRSGAIASAGRARSRSGAVATANRPTRWSRSDPPLALAAARYLAGATSGGSGSVR
jgi:hypothetical protein